MAEFYVPPEWENLPPPELPEFDPDRIEGLQNGFLAATQDALHTAPDAFFRKTGQDAVEGLPALQEKLSQLRDAALGQARDEGERAALAPRLEANLTSLHYGIDRHVAAQKQVRNRQIIAERQALTQRLAELEHGDDTILPSLAEAHASAAQELARLNGADEESAMQAARSAIWRTAIGQRLATGQSPQALDLFDKVQDRLAPVDQCALEVPLQVARTDSAADQWIARETGKDGEPLVTRVQADNGLSPAEKATVLAKVEARDSAQESARIATVQGLDDKLEATAHSLATAPGTYKPGTLAALANAYDDAGESDKAETARRMALQESFLLPFARSGAATQQRLIDSLPEGEDRAAAEAIQRRQAEAFAQDPFTAGTALYPDVGPPAPINDLTDRIVQARTIAAYRDLPVAPFTADEIVILRGKFADGTLKERQELLAQLSALPDDMKAAIVPVRTSLDDVDKLPRGVELAKATPDDFRELGSSARQGIAPPTEPPSNDLDLEKEFQAWPGVKVTLPNGDGIRDPKSPTGYVMAPFNDLKSVAEAGKRAQLDFALSPVATLRHYLGQGGMFDYQRRRYAFGKEEFTQLRQFRNISNVNVGLFCRKLGLPLWVTLTLAGEYASRNSSNAKSDEPYGLDAQTREYIEKGWNIGDSGAFD
jgi:hypothetical protein